MIKEKLPQYFDELQDADRYYGEIIREKDRWIIKAEPQVTMMIKALFPLTEVSEGGIAHFPVNKRHIAELNWFMMRYPLKIKNIGAWRRDMIQAEEYFKERIKITQNISSEEPSIKFQGHLFEFQKIGLSFLSNNKTCLLADEMGLGKTVEALGYLSKRRFPVIICVPSHLLHQWQDEIKRFLGEDIRIQIIKGLNPKNNPLEKDVDIYLIHYLLLRGWKDELLKLNYETIIFDEIQELRHNQSQKYDCAREISKQRESIIGLSGTPIYNYGAEIWNVMNIIEPLCLGDWGFFTKEWCGHIGNVFVKDPKMLGNYLIQEGLMLRRRKEEVLLELPPKRRIIQHVDLNEEMYLKLIQKSVEIIYEIPTLVTKKDKKRIGAMFLDAVNNARRASGIAKASNVCDFVNLIVDAGESCLLFAYHHDVIDIYMRLLNKHNPMCISGRETREEKQDAVKDFMEDRTNLLIVNLRTTAGLNLQRAKCVVFGELDWSPAVHRQAEDRIHRIGQKDSVLCYYLVADTEADEKIMGILGLKESQFLGLMHDKSETDEDKLLSQRKSNQFMSELLDNLRDNPRYKFKDDGGEFFSSQP